MKYPSHIQFAEIYRHNTAYDSDPYWRMVERRKALAAKVKVEYERHNDTRHLSTIHNLLADHPISSLRPERLPK